MEIIIDNRQTRIDIDPEALRKTTERVLGDLGCSPTTILSLVIVDAAEMAELNRTFRGKEGPTNVLSFAQQEGEPSAARDLLGDVVICADVAARDADALGYTREEMTAYLLIHGILHLQGYEHDVERDAEAMQKRVDEIFNAIYG